MGGTDGSSFSASALFVYSNVHHDCEREVVCAVKLIAPDMDTDDKRPPLNIVATIDTSGSMSGSKLRYAKESLTTLVQHLGPDDTLAMIEFNNRPTTIFEPRKMNGAAKSGAQAAINKLRATGGTGFVEALGRSIALIKRSMKSAPDNAVSRIIMFTDGQSNGGDRDVPIILDAIDKNEGEGFSVTSFGYGAGVNVEMLQELAQRGKGSYYYIEDTEQCGAVFGTELGGLISTYASGVRVTLNLADGVEFKGWVDAGYKTDGTTIEMPDILAGETKYVLCRLKLPKKSRAVCARPSRVAAVSVKYTDMVEYNEVDTGFNAQIQYVRKQADVDETPNEEVQEQLLILDTAKALEEAKSLADMGNFAGAQERFLQMRRDYSCVGVKSNLVDAIMGVAQDSFTNQAAYAASRNSMTSSTYALRSRRGTGDEALDGLLLNDVQLRTRASFQTSDD
jgi:Ca-activated chloride channel family protein